MGSLHDEQGLGGERVAGQVRDEPLRHHLTSVRVHMDKTNSAATMLVPDEPGGQAVGLTITRPQRDLNRHSEKGKFYHYQM
jgi:hypothetical protein